VPHGFSAGTRSLLAEDVALQHDLAMHGLNFNPVQGGLSSRAGLVPAPGSRSPAPMDAGPGSSLRRDPVKRFPDAPAGGAGECGVLMGLKLIACDNQKLTPADFEGLKIW